MALTSIWKRLRFPSRSKRNTRLPIQLGHNRIYILPTKSGIAFSVLLALMLLISINYNNPPGYLLTFLLAGLALIGIFHTHRGISGLRISHGQASPVFAGDRAVFPIMIFNPSNTARHAIRIGWTRVEAESAQNVTSGPTENPASSPESGKIFVPCRDIQPHQEALFAPSLPSGTRGLLRPARIVVSTVYPLGLYRAWSWVPLPLTCVIYPAPESRASPFAAHNSPGDSEHGPIGRKGDEYHGLRAYQQGDPLRRIAWKAVAKGDDLISKEFVSTDNATLLLLDWDNLPGEETETRLARLCRGVLDAEKTGQPYSLHIPGQRITPGSGPGQMHACLTALALFRPNSEEPS